MAYYVKVSKKVYDRFDFVEGQRLQLADGNYVLWQADLIKLGGELEIKMSKPDLVTYLQDIASAVGALLLNPYEAKEEQDGKTLRELPEPTDPRFAEPKAEAVEEAPETEGEEAPEVNEETSETEEEKEVEDEYGVSE
jgi:hypothetical protein